MEVLQRRNELKAEWSGRIFGFDFIHGSTCAISYPDSQIPEDVKCRKYKPGKQGGQNDERHDGSHENEGSPPESPRMTKNIVPGVMTRC